MINKIVMFLLFTCTYVYTQAQVNLVKNGAFEKYTTCPTSLDQVSYAPPWNGIDTNWTPGMPGIPSCLPEYINGCSVYDASSEPINHFFYQYPHSGKGMMQVVMYDDTIIDGHVFSLDHLQGRLYHSLVAGQSYCVTFYTVRDNYCAFAVNNIGAYFDDGTIDTASYCSDYQTAYTPQVLDTALITDTLNWIKIQGSFIANGSESFITIGTFADTAHIEHVRFPVGNRWEGLYLIDDVSVIASSTTAYAGPDKTIRPGDSTYIGIDSNGEGMPCYWYTLGSTTPIDSGGRIRVKPDSSTTYVVSIDLCGHVTYDTVRVNVHTLSIQNAQIQNVQIFPNPMQNELIITSGEQIRDVVVTDVLGRVIFAKTYDANHVTINVSSLPPGFYFVKVNGVVRSMVKE